MSQLDLPFAKRPKPRKPKAKPAHRYAVLVYDDFLGEWTCNGIIGGCLLWGLRERIRGLERQGFERSMMRVERIGRTVADAKRELERDRKFTNVRKRDR